MSIITGRRAPQFIQSLASPNSEFALLFRVPQATVLGSSRNIRNVFPNNNISNINNNTQTVRATAIPAIPLSHQQQQQQTAASPALLNPNLGQNPRRRRRRPRERSTDFDDVLTRPSVISPFSPLLSETEPGLATTTTGTTTDDEQQEESSNAAANLASTARSSLQPLPRMRAVRTYSDEQLMAMDEKLNEELELLSYDEDFLESVAHDPTRTTPELQSIYAEMASVETTITALRNLSRNSAPGSALRKQAETEIQNLQRQLRDLDPLLRVQRQMSRVFKRQDAITNELERRQQTEEEELEEEEEGQQEAAEDVDMNTLPELPGTARLRQFLEENWEPRYTQVAATAVPAEPSRVQQQQQFENAPVAIPQVRSKRRGVQPAAQQTGLASTSAIPVNLSPPRT
jgi:hypothetical protein